MDEIIYENQLDKLLKEKGLSSKRFSEYSKVSRPIIDELRKNPQKNCTSETIKKICECLGVPFGKLFKKVFVSDIHSDYPYSFNDKNIHFFNTRTQKNGFNFKIHRWSENRSMDIDMYYSNNRRFAISADFRSNGYSLPELEILDLRVQINKTNVEYHEIKEVLGEVMSSLLDFAKYAKFYQVEYLISASYSEIIQYSKINDRHFDLKRATDYLKYETASELGFKVDDKFKHYQCLRMYKRL